VVVRGVGYTSLRAAVGVANGTEGSQSARTHKKVEHVLDMLRDAAGLEPGQVKKVVR
jgi:hypothetical protein